MASFYDGNSGRHIVDHDEILSRKVFYIHGTTSDNKRWNGYKDSILQINRIAFSLGIKNNKDINAELLYIQSDEFLNKYCDFNFQWGSSKTSNGGFNDNESNGLLNTVEDRRIASVKLLSHIKANLGNAEEIVLIGHSHGGNIAIQTADKIFDEMPQIKNVYVLTIGTPAYNLEFIVSLVRNDNLQPISDNIFLSILNKNIYIYSALALNKIDFLTYIKSKGCNFLYLNCENPKLWNKKYIDRIEHIALWNSTDYVDNISKAYDVTFDPYVAMSCVSSHFTNHKTHNVKFKLSKKQIASNYKSSLKPIIEWIAKLDNLNRQLWILRGKYIFNISSFFKLCSYETYYQKTCSKYYHNTQDINAIDALYVQKSISYDKFKINNRNISKSDVLNDDHYGFKDLFENEDLFIKMLNTIDASLYRCSKYPVNSLPFMKETEILAKNEANVINSIKNKMYQTTSYIELSRAIYNLENTSIGEHGFDIAYAQEIKDAIDKGDIKPFPRVRRTIIDR